MGVVNYPMNNGIEMFASMFKNIDDRLRALETQQLFVITDNQGRVVGQLGPQSDAKPGIQFFDSNGNSRIRLGLLANGDYGLRVTDANGYGTEILPVYQANVTTTESTASTSYADLATPGPSVTAVIGASQQALLTVNSYIGILGSATNNVQSGGFVGVGIDGAAPSGSLDRVLYFANTSTGVALGQAANQSAQIVVTNLSAGPHTFKMVYEMDGPGTVSFGRRFLQVRPL